MKKVLLLTILLTSVLWQNQANAQCSAPLSITPTANPGEVTLEYDLGGVASPSTFYGEISFYNSTTSTSYNNVYVTQGNNPLTYQFVENGTYDIWSLTMDTNSTCIDTIYYTYQVTGISGTSCNADFNIVNDSLTTTDYYGFNYSTGTNLTYSWDFGDGGTSTDQYPVHTFLTTGTFNICLTIDDGNGCTDTHCQTLTVYTKATNTSLNIHDPATASFVKEEINEISVYPNPSNGDFAIAFNSNDSKTGQINILDLQGKVIVSKNFESTAGQNKVNFDLNGIATGVYFWQFNNGTTGKLIVE